MIIGPNSFKKMCILAVLVMAGVADFIAAMNNAVVAKVNAAVISVGFILTAVWLYRKWSKESEELYKNQ